MDHMTHTRLKFYIECIEMGEVEKLKVNMNERRTNSITITITITIT